MKRTISNIITICAIITLIGWIVSSSIVINDNKKIIREQNESIFKYKNTTDSLYLKIDSIQSKIDTVYQDRIKLKYVYEQKADSIWNQSADDDWNFYTSFLSTKFPSDTATIKAN